MFLNSKNSLVTNHQIEKIPNSEKKIIILFNTVEGMLLIRYKEMLVRPANNSSNLTVM